MEDIHGVSPRERVPRKTALSDRMAQRVAVLEQGLPSLIYDHDLLELEARGHSAQLIYLSPESRDFAFRNLGQEEIAEVVCKRLRDWTPDVAAQGIPWLYQQQRRSLFLAAGMSRVTPAGSEVSRHFSDILAHLAIFNEGGQYESLELVSLLSLVREGDARIHFEMREAASASDGDEEERSRLRTLVEAHSTYCHELGPVLAALGHAEGQDSLPPVGLPRVVFSAAPTQALIRRVTDSGESFAHWQGGLVFRCDARELEQWATGAEAIQVLYFQLSQFQDDLRELTLAQQAREFSLRGFERQGSSLAARQAFLQDLLVDQQVLRRLAWERAERDRKGELASIVLAAQLQRSDEHLRSTLAAPGRGPSGGAETSWAELYCSEKQSLEDARFFAALSQLHRRGELASEYRKIALIKAQFLQRLALFAEPPSEVGRGHA